MRRTVMAGLLAASVSSPVFAAPVTADVHDYLTGYVGYADVLDDYEDSAQFGIEYRARSVGYGVRPTVGFNIDHLGAKYGYAGLNFEWPITGNWIAMPNFMVGAYSPGGGKDLGAALEFRSGIEFAYELENMHRIGIAFNHISNASLHNKNPGSETLLLSYSVPFGAVTGALGF